MPNLSVHARPPSAAALTPEAAAAAAKEAEAAMDEAAEELGLGGAENKLKLRRTLGYATYAWTEYEQVVKKWEQAQEAINVARRSSPNEDDGHWSYGAGGGGSIGKSASCGQLPNDSAPIRRTYSEPTLPPPPNPLALSLSMITSHTHDEEDEQGVTEEW